MNIKSNEERENYIAESYSSGLRYQILNNKLEGVHPAIFCKDFISDVIWAEDTSQPAEIYGFRYFPGRISTSKDTIKIGLDYKDGVGNKEFTTKLMDKMTTVLRYVEDTLGIKKTMMSIRNKGNFLLVEASKAWFKAPYMTSLYTLLLRYSMKYSEGDVRVFLLEPQTSCNDALYLNQSKEAMKKILDGYTVDDKWKNYKYVSSVHDGSGLTSLNLKKVKWNEPKRVS